MFPHTYFAVRMFTNSYFPQSLGEDPGGPTFDDAGEYRIRWFRRGRR